MTDQPVTCFEDLLRDQPHAAAAAIAEYISTVMREGNGHGPTMTITVPLTAEMVDPRLYPSSDRRLVAARVLAEIMTKAFTFAPVLNPRLAEDAKAVAGGVGNPLNNDAHNECRAIHRVIRAMHDGECPNCHNLYASTDMVKIRASGDVADHVCPGCGFTITHEQSEAGLKLFGEFMEKNLKVFERWRHGLSDLSYV